MKFTNLLIIIAVLLGSSPFAVAEKSAEFDAGARDTKSSSLNAAQALELLTAEKDVIVLDVRTPQEFSIGHIEGAINININGDAFGEKIGKLEKGKTYLLHCAAGVPKGRSRRAEKLMKKLEFKQLYHLDGGFIAWQLSGKPFQTEENADKDQLPMDPHH